MIVPSALVAALVAKLRLVPELVTGMGGDATRIYGYLDVYPQNTNRMKAVHSMPSPAVMVCYDDWGEGSMGPGAPINHSLSIYVRPADGAAYADLTTYLVAGVPAGQTLAMCNVTILDDLDLMRIEGRCGPSLDEEGIEFCSLKISFNEKWG